MLFKTHLVLFLLMIKLVAAASNINEGGFIFNRNWSLNGVAEVISDGVVRLTSSTTKFGVGHAFYSLPFKFKNSSNGNAFSFSTTFVFSIVRDNGGIGGSGMAFVIAPSKQISNGLPAQYLGIFNSTNNGNSSNHIVAIELDTIVNKQFDDINDNHVGIDINGLISIKSSPAGYYTTTSTNENSEIFQNLTLASGDPILAWVDYDGIKKQINVTLSPTDIEKPIIPILSLDIDISPFILDQMYVGFSASTGLLVQSCYVLGWSFQLNGKAQEVDLSWIPSLQPTKKQTKPKKKKNKKKTILAIGLSATGTISVLVSISVILFLVKRKSKFDDDVVEDWEVQYGPHRFPYKDLFSATKGFKDNELLGKGGFGEVYRGALPVSNIQVAVKRISQKSQQGMKEFVAEIATIGRLRHPNLVRLIGYCRRKGEFFLVYDYMPNTSLDKFIFNNPASTLNWNQRLKIIKDVATGLAYLHEEWVEVVIHRDIKASNVLLDGELNGKLGDFGLARCIKHGIDPQITHVAGTLGYIAPELARNGKATTRTDVFAFGAFCLEVACGRRPVEPRASAEEVILVDWMLECLGKGEVFKMVDPKLKNDFKEEEMKVVLKIGMLCSHPVAAIRPNMSLVLRYLKGDASIPEELDALLTQEQWLELNEYNIPHHSSSHSTSYKPSLVITESLLTTGR